jgi:hypothetical protein
MAEALCCRSGVRRSFGGLFEAVHWTRQQARSLAAEGGFQSLSEDTHAEGLTVIGEVRDGQGRLLDLEPLIDLRVHWAIRGQP